MTDTETSGQGLAGLSRRAKTALGVAAASLFLLLCLTTYGREQAEIVRRTADAGIAPTIAGWFVALCGAGAYVVAILGLAWGVIVYFQERTPDLVLRGVGTAVLAVSTAMLAGLVGDGERSLWAGAVGTAAAKTLLGWGTLGRVFGWLAGLGLFAVSLAFATDWLFRTVRRGDRAASAMPRIPTEPSRGELLEDPADAEPRLFVRSESRASTTAAAMAAQAPAVSPPIGTTPSPRIVHDLLEDEFLTDVRTATPSAPPREEPLAAPAARALPADEPEAPERPAPRPADPQAEIPEGWARLRFDGRDLVRAPQGYSGVEFLPENDELATPETAQVRAATAARTVASFVDEVTYHAPQVQDIDLSPDEPEAPPPAPTARRAPEPPVQRTPEPPVAEASFAHAPHAEASPSGGIGLADPDLLLDDEVLSVAVAPFADLEGPAHDGASAADEIVSAYAAPAPAPAPLAPPAPVATPAAPPSEEARSALVEDDVLVGTTLFSDDVLLFAEPEAPQMPAAEPPPPAPTLAAPPAAPSPSPVQSAESEEVVAIPADVGVEPWDFPPVHAIDLGIDVEPADAVEAANAVEEQVAQAAAAPVVEARDAESLDASAAPATPLLDDEIAIADPYEAETTDVSVLAPRAAPAAGTPSSPAAPVEVRAEPAPPSSAPQLALFPPPACDLSKLAALELDPLFHAAADGILVRGRASAVVLQRTLGIGYARALRILDQMTAAGMLGPDAPGGSREICFTREQWAGSRA